MARVQIGSEVNASPAFMQALMVYLTISNNGKTTARCFSFSKTSARQNEVRLLSPFQCKQAPRFASQPYFKQRTIWQPTFTKRRI